MDTRSHREVGFQGHQDQQVAVFQLLGHQAHPECAERRPSHPVVSVLPPARSAAALYDLPVPEEAS